MCSKVGMRRSGELGYYGWKTDDPEATVPRASSTTSGGGVQSTGLKIREAICSNRPCCVEDSRSSVMLKVRCKPLDEASEGFMKLTTALALSANE